MNSTQLQYFLVLAQKHNYSEAADMLFVTQPTLSRNIIALEEEIGATLFSRDKNGTRLTPAGQAFYDGIRPITLRYDTLLESVRNIESGLAGTLTISLTSEQVMPGAILDAITAYHAQYPSVEIRFCQCSATEMRTKLLEDAVDVGILVDFSEFKQMGLQQLTLLEEVPCLAVSRKSSSQDAVEVTANELFSILAEHPLILPTPAALGQEMSEPIAAFRQMLHLETASFHVQYVDDASALPLYVGAGLGVTIANRSHVISQDSRIKMLEIPFGDRYRKILWYKQNSKNPVRNSFMAYLTTCGILPMTVD